MASSNGSDAHTLDVALDDDSDSDGNLKRRARFPSPPSGAAKLLSAAPPSMPRWLGFIAIGGVTLLVVLTLVIVGVVLVVNGSAPAVVTDILCGATSTAPTSAHAFSFLWPNGSLLPTDTAAWQAGAVNVGYVNASVTWAQQPPTACVSAATVALTQPLLTLQLWMFAYNPVGGALTHAPNSPLTLCPTAAQGAPCCFTSAAINTSLTLVAAVSMASSPAVPYALLALTD
jgi:hypothetical protein